MTFDKMQLAILAVYVFSTGVCVGKTFTKDNRLVQRTFISFVPVLNFFIACLVIILPIVDRFQLYVKHHDDESDSIER